jgi:hypothetical protein
VSAVQFVANRHELPALKQALQEIRRPDHLAVLEWKPQVGDTGVEIIQEATDGRG